MLAWWVPASWLIGNRRGMKQRAILFYSKFITLNKKCHPLPSGSTSASHRNSYSCQRFHSSAWGVGRCAKHQMLSLSVWSFLV